MDVLIGVPERNWALVFVLNAGRLEETCKHNANKTLWVELEMSKSDDNILHCIANRFYFWLFTGVRKWQNLLFIRDYTYVTSRGLAAIFKVLRFSYESKKSPLFSHCVMAVNICWKHETTLHRYCLESSLITAVPFLIISMNWCWNVGLFPKCFAWSFHVIIWDIGNSNPNNNNNNSFSFFIFPFIFFT